MCPIRYKCQRNLGGRPSSLDPSLLFPASQTSAKAPAFALFGPGKGWSFRLRSITPSESTETVALVNKA